MNSKAKLVRDFAILWEVRNKMDNYTERVRKVFAGSIAKGWDTKSNYIQKINGKDNQVYEKIKEFGQNGMTLLDVGCATGRLLQKTDLMFEKCKLVGIDFSDDMILYAKKKRFSANNHVDLICDDWLEYNFGKALFDIIVFKFVFHHFIDEEAALKKAKSLLKVGGRLIIYTPGGKYLSEIFGEVKDEGDCLGRKKEEQISDLLQKTDMENATIESCKFQLSLKNFSDFINFLKSIGSYQKILNYSNSEWDDKFMGTVQNRYKENMWHSGEYLLINYKNSDQE